MSYEILDLEVLKENYEGDEDLLLSARDTFLSSWEKLYLAIGTSAQNGDLQQLANDAHALKGSTGVFWPKHVQTMLASIEDTEESNRLSYYNENKDNLDKVMKQLVEELTRLTLEDLTS